MRLRLLVLLLVAGIASAAPPAADPPAAEPAALRLPQTTLTEDQRVVHALNRLGFGPRPGEVEKVRKEGLVAWIEQQLEPGSIDETEVEQRIAGLGTLRRSSIELLTDYPPPRLLRQLDRTLTTRAGMDSDAVGQAFPELAEQKKPSDDEPVEKKMRRALGGPGRRRSTLTRSGRSPMSSKRRRYRGSGTTSSRATEPMSATATSTASSKRGRNCGPGRCRTGSWPRRPLFRARAIST